MPLTNKITTINQLIGVLERDEKNYNYESIVSQLRLNFKDIEHLCFWDSDHYSRINIAIGKNYTIDLICWEKEQHSLIHNHQKDKAWFYILKGEITENLYLPMNNKKFNLKEVKVLSPKKTSHLNHGGSIYHELINSYNGRSVSLHLYVK